MTLYFRFK